MVKDVSIILPLYNEAYGVERAVRSAAGQCEVMYIADNASTDSTSEICERLAAEFPNIVYKRHDRNMGGDYNGACLLAQVKTPYFICFGGHDYIGPGYAAKLKQMMDDNPDAVLAAGRCLGVFMDTKTPIVRPRPDHSLLASADPFTRVCHVASGHCSGAFDGFIQYGLRRTDAYRKCCAKSIPRMGGDLVLLMRQALMGRILLTDDVALYYEQYRLLSWRKALYRLHPEDVQSDLLERTFSRMVKWMHLQLLRAARTRRMPSLLAPEILKTRWQTTSLYTGFRVGRHDVGGWLCDKIKSMARKFLFVREGDDFLLRSRLKELKAKGVFEGRRVALYGSGLHTSRLLDTAILPSTSVVAIFDDAPKVESIEGVAVLHVSKASEVKFDMLMPSSDTVEGALYANAREWAPEGVRIVRMYSWRIWRQGLKRLFATMMPGSGLCLSRRLHSIAKLCGGRRVALYGAGVHTRRLLETGILPKDRIVAIFDDAPKEDAVEGVPVLHVSKASEVKFDMLIPSSDTIEDMLCANALAWLPDGVRILRLYSWRLRLAELKMSLMPLGPGNDYFLRSRLQALRRGVLKDSPRLGLYGAGMHTRRLLATGIIPKESIVAIFDDAPKFDSIEGVPVLPVSKASDADCKFILASSDTMETELYKKARRWAPNGVKVLRLYSWRLRKSKPKKAGNATAGTAVRPEYESDHFLFRIYDALRAKGFAQGMEVAIYGSGIHTKWLAKTGLVPEGAVTAVFEDTPRSNLVEGVRCLPVSDAPKESFDFLIVSADSEEEELEMSRKAMAWAPSGVPILLAHARRCLAEKANV